jgi:hypothetical protein
VASIYKAVPGEKEGSKAISRIYHSPNDFHSEAEK